MKILPNNLNKTTNERYFMTKDKSYYLGYSKPQFLIICARNVILQIPEEQDNLLMDYSDNITKTILTYLSSTTKDNLKMIFENQFEFKMKFNETDRIFNFKFDYYH